MKTPTLAAVPVFVVPSSVLQYIRNRGTDEGYIIATIMMPHMTK